MTASDQLSSTYFYDNGSYTAPDAFDFKVQGNILHRQAAPLSESHIFNPSLLNSAHLGFSRVFSDAPTTLNAINPAAAAATLGFLPNLPVGLITVGSGITGFVGGLSGVGEYVFHYNSFQIYDDVYLTQASTR